MKRKPVTLLLCCLCLVLLTGAYLVLKSSNEKAEQEAAEEDGTEPILTISPDEVRSVSFQIDGSSATFSRTDDTDNWSLAEDADFPVDPSPITNMLGYLAPLGAVRTLTDTAALSEYGLDAPQNTIIVTTQDGTETTIALGNTNNSTGDDYIMLNDDSSTLYTISTELRSSLSDNLYDYAAGEELPTLMASDITNVDVSLDSQSLILSLEDNLWTVSDRDTTLADVDQDAVSQSISDLTGLSYVDFLDYNCTTPEQYGLNPPTATVTISWKDDSAGDSDETDSSDETETEISGNESEINSTEAEALSSETETDTENTGDTGAVQQLILHIGTTDESGNYYVQQEGSTEIHTMAADLIEKILGWTAEDFEAEPESESETETDADSQAAAEMETDFQTETDAEAEVETNSQTAAEAETDFQAETDAEAETETDADLQTMTDSDAEAESETDR